jgi:predicted DNA-binding transcriptional regulator
MREQVEKIIAELQEALLDLELVEKGTRGYKAAAVRARRATLEASKELKEIRKQVQEVKNSHQ